MTKQETEVVRGKNGAAEVDRFLQKGSRFAPSAKSIKTSSAPAANPDKAIYYTSKIRRLSN